MRPLHVGHLLLAAPLACLATVGAARSTAKPCDPSGPTTSIQVVAHGLHNSAGQVLVALFAAEEGFPKEVEHAVQRGVATIEDDAARFTFDPEPRGRYAISVLHDENGDGAMKTGSFGRPREGWGVSRNARRRFAPPQFGQAAFDADEDSVLVELELRY